MSLKSNNVEFVRHCGGHFENSSPLLLHPTDKKMVVALLKIMISVIFR
jgi:hypothetical protein